MGLSNKKRGNNRTFARIKDGLFLVETREGEVLNYNTLTGIISDVHKEERKTAAGQAFEVWEIDVDDISLSIPVDSRYAGDFLKRLPNINLDLEVELCPYQFQDKVTKKMRSGMYIMQKGKKVAPAYTKEEPNGLPEPTSREWKGKTEWDFSAQVAFFEKMVQRTSFGSPFQKEGQDEIDTDYGHLSPDDLPEDDNSERY